MARRPTSSTPARSGPANATAPARSHSWEASIASTSNGARYGVHRATLRVDSPTGDRELGQHLTAAIGSYVREMGVDPRLLDLWGKAGPDEMYVLSPQQAKDLDVVNNGRLRPVWSVTPFPGGTLLQGRQATADGTGTVFFSCDDTRTVFGAVDAAAGDEDAPAAGGWSQSADDRQSRNTSGGAGRLEHRTASSARRSSCRRLWFVWPCPPSRLATPCAIVGASVRAPGATAWTSMIDRRRPSGGSWHVVRGRRRSKDRAVSVDFGRSRSTYRGR